MRRTKNLAEVIRRKLAADPELAEAVARERMHANVAGVIADLREAAGLTQQELATRAGTHQSVIARLEDADYDSHSLKMLQRIAEALGKQIEVRFVGPAETGAHRAAKTWPTRASSARGSRPPGAPPKRRRKTAANKR